MKKNILLATCLLGSSLLSPAALTWSFTGTIPADKQAAITAAMNTAVANYNTYASYFGNIVVTYNSSVPTAQTDGMFGWIEFGGSISSRVAEHEIGHWIGCGTYWDWNNHRSNGQWTGANAIARVQAYDGPTAVVGCDVQHFWPYGWNYDNEGPADRNIGMVGALRRDMGLNDGTFGIASGTYRLQNRADAQMLDNLGLTANGAGVGQKPASTSTTQKWVVTFGGGYFKLSCVANSEFLDTLGHTTNGSAIGQWASSTSYNQQWTITQTDPGYFKIMNRANGEYLDTGGQTATGAIMQNRINSTNYTQQWRFVQ
jgi:hypothetical protein